MHFFEIAGISFSVTGGNHPILSRYKAFSISFQDTSDVRISMRAAAAISRPGGEILMDEGIVWSWSSGLRIYKYKKDSMEISALLEPNEDWSEASITYIKRDEESEFTAAASFFEIIFRNRLLFQQGMVLHASAIDWEGRGILFSAPSGTGKSTQAALWKRYMGARLLNGDRPAVRVPDKQAMVYGTPWSGSTNDFENSHTPAAMVVLLQQAEENSLNRLSNAQALSLLLPRCFLPYHDGIIMNEALHHFERIIAAIPVYLLRCRPDREAVDLVASCIK